MRINKLSSLFTLVFAFGTFSAQATAAAPSKKRPVNKVSTAKALTTRQATAQLPTGADWQQMDLQAGDQLQIEGLRGEVNVSFVDAGPKLAIRVRQNGNVQNQLVVRDGHQIGVRTPTQLSTSDWEKVAAGQIAPVSYQVEVVAGPVPVAITWREGSVKVTGSKQLVSVSGIKGKLELSDESGGVRAQWLDGSIDVSRNKGALNLSTASAQVQIQDSEGSLQIQNHVGRTKLKSIQGDLKFTSFKGVLSAEDIKAGTEIQAGQASVTVKGLTGSLRGQNEQGDTFVQLGGKSTMKFDSDKGDIRVRLAKGVGARLNLVTEGRLIPPGNIRVGVDGRNRVASGRVEGEDTSTVAIHSKTGQITVGM